MAKPDPSLDYSANYARQIGYNDPEFDELMRLYLVLHAYSTFFLLNMKIVTMKEETSVLMPGI